MKPIGNPDLRWLLLTLGVLVLLIGSGCAASSPAVDVVGYAASPIANLSAQSTPAANAIRRPTRAPAAARPVATPSPGQTDSVVVADSAVDATAGQGNAGQASSDAAVAADPLSTPEATGSTTTVGGNAATSSASSRAKRVTRRPTPGVVPGEVDASVGKFVTSDSRSTRYYYARADARWRRIRAIHQKWFASVADLLKAYPNRVPRAPARPRSTRTPATPTPTVTG